MRLFFITAAIKSPLTHKAEKHHQEAKYHFLAPIEAGIKDVALVNKIGGHHSVMYVRRKVVRYCTSIFEICKTWHGAQLEVYISA